MDKPNALRRGDTVAIVSLSSGILGEPAAKHQRQLGIKRLHAFGLHVRFMPNALRGMAFLKAHPEARAADLKTAFKDPQIKGIIAAIGGDDTYRLLPHLLNDPDFKEAVHHHPKLFTGFSDTTINHLMFYQLGLQTFYGPNFLNDLAELETQMLPYSKATFERFFTNQERTPILSSPVWYEERTDFSPSALGIPRRRHQEKRGYECPRGQGQIYGELLGGCLDSFGDLLTNTRYPDEAKIAIQYHLIPPAKAWQGKLLFLETSEEQPSPSAYRHLLRLLARKGILAQVAGIITGKPQNESYYDAYQTILLEETDTWQTPLLTNVNFGHAYPRTALPYGAKACLDCDHKALTIETNFFA